MKNKQLTILLGLMFLCFSSCKKNEEQSLNGSFSDLIGTWGQTSYREQNEDLGAPFQSFDTTILVSKAEQEVFFSIQIAPIFFMTIMVQSLKIEDSL